MNAPHELIRQSVESSEMIERPGLSVDVLYCPERLRVPIVHRFKTRPAWRIRLWPLVIYLERG